MTNERSAIPGTSNSCFSILFIKPTELFFSYYFKTKKIDVSSLTWLCSMLNFWRSKYYKVGCFGTKTSEHCHAQGFKVDKSATKQ